MSYIGFSAPIHIAKGVISDLPRSNRPADSLASATNIEMNEGVIRKLRGSTKFSTVTLDGQVVSLYDWWPEADKQRLIAATTAGKIYRDTGNGSFSSNTPIASGVGNLTTDMKMVAGGSEASGQSRKLFLFSSFMVPKYINGDGTALPAFTNLATDWASANPTFGIVHLNRLWAFGNSNQPHRAYSSVATNHSDFTGAGSATWEIYPGVGEFLTSAIVYKGTLFVFKYPQGVFYLDTPTFDSADWGFKLLDSSFGIGNPNGLVAALDDVVLMNAENSITSVKATEAFGDLKFGDVIANAKFEKYYRDNFDETSKSYTQAVYYTEKKSLYLTMRSEGSTATDRIISLDVKDGFMKPTVITKDIPNCITMRKDTNKISRPCYGTVNGDVFIMDSSGYLVDGDTYIGEFKTQELDFGHINPQFIGKNKIFEFLTLVYEAVSSGSIFVDVTVDGRAVETLEFLQATGVVLGNFLLGTDVLGASNELNEVRVPIHGSGRRIQLRVYQPSGSGFAIENMIIDFRLGDEGASVTNPE